MYEFKSLSYFVYLTRRVEELYVLRSFELRKTILRSQVYKIVPLLAQVGFSSIPVTRRIGVGSIKNVFNLGFQMACRFLLVYKPDIVMSVRVRCVFDLN